jgi:hypothetical protein
MSGFIQLFKCHLPTHPKGAVIAAVSMAVLLAVCFGQVARAADSQEDGFPTQISNGPEGTGQVLVSGRAGRLEWEMTAFRRREHPADEPCFTMSSTIRGSGSYLTGGIACGVISPGTHRPLPAITSSRQTRTEILGLAFGLDVRRLRIEASNGSMRGVKTSRLDRSLGDELRLRPFSFAAVVFRRGECYRRIWGLSGRSKKIFELQRKSCF